MQNCTVKSTQYGEKTIETPKQLNETITQFHENMLEVAEDLFEKAENNRTFKYSSGIDQNIEGHHQNTNGSRNCLSYQQFSDGFLPKIV